jgi:hypothetical protein
MLISLSLLLNLAICALPQNSTRVEEFTRIVFAADEVGETKAMQKALREYKEDVILAYISRVERRLNADLPEIERWVDMFKYTWEETYNTDFAENYDRYIQRLSPKSAKVRTSLIFGGYLRVQGAHLKIISEKEGDWKGTMDDAEFLVTTFVALGDLYYLARAHYFVGNLYNPIYYAHDDADSQKAYDAYLAARTACDRLGLRQDKFYSDLNIVIRELKDVLGEHEKEIDVKKEKTQLETIPLREGSVTAALTGTAEFSMESNKSKVVHASEAYDSDFYSWLTGTIPVVGEAVQITNVKPVVSLVRMTDDECLLEAGAESSETFRLSSSGQVVTVMRKHSDGSLLPYYLEIKVGSTDSVYQGIKKNLKPYATGGTYFYRSPAVVDFDTDLAQVRLYDTNVDGQFGYEEMVDVWCVGLLPEERFWRPDAVTIGKQKHSQPFSRYVSDKKGDWYELLLDSSLSPKSLSLIPMQPVLGEIEFVVKGVKGIKPLSILLRSESVATKGLVIDLMALPKKKLVPIGSYKFLQARYGDKNGHEALVTPDPTLPIILDVTLDPKQVAELRLGGEFKIVAPATLDGTTVDVDGSSIHLVGASGERWFRFIGAPLFETEVSVSGAKTVFLSTPTEAEAAEEWRRYFYPMPASLELRKPPSEVELTLSFKKHPWFGNLKSTFTVKSE